MENGPAGDEGRGTGERAATQGRPYGGWGRSGEAGGAGGGGAPPLHGYRKFVRRGVGDAAPYERERRCGVGENDTRSGVRGGNPSVSLRLTAPVAVPKILCSLNAHRILTAATRSPRCLCPRQRWARSPFAQGSLGPAGDEGRIPFPVSVLSLFVSAL